MADRGDQSGPFANTVSRPVLITVLIAGLIAVAVISVVLTRVPSTPEKSVKDFVSSRIGGNESKAAGLTLQGKLDDFGGGEFALSGTGSSFSATVSEIDGDSAVVIVHYQNGDQTADVPYKCVRVSGNWKIDLAGTEGLWMEESP